MLESNPRAITEALGGRWYGTYGLAFCPAHNNTETPALSVSSGKNGQLLLYCHAGCEFSEICTALQGRTGSRNHVLNRPVVPKKEGKFLTPRSIWDAADKVSGSPAETYLKARGIADVTSDVLRFHPRCRHRSGHFLPALVARVDGSAEFAIHRTYLAADDFAKASVTPNKMMLGRCRGGAVRLLNEGELLVVAEGIETALSLASGILERPFRLWAALSTSGMMNLRLPSKPGTLIVAPDGDVPGLGAACQLAKRALRLGWTVKWFAAPSGKDWNDVLVERGAHYV